ncbi:MAG: FAD-dependent oxidoreductase, partial [Chthoniobacteraceae bacterium]|nr:FAD-dependent oxidoreductase [Chthoniobacteraceae bacterium]
MTPKTQKTRRDFIRTSTGLLLGSLLSDIVLAENTESFDVCVYGATASGIAAALGAADAGAKVLVVEP